MTSLLPQQPPAPRKQKHPLLRELGTGAPQLRQEHAPGAPWVYPQQTLSSGLGAAATLGSRVHQKTQGLTFGCALVSFLIGLEKASGPDWTNQILTHWSALLLTVEGSVSHTCPRCLAACQAQSHYYHLPTQTPHCFLEASLRPCRLCRRARSWRGSPDSHKENDQPRSKRLLY